jgi:hypothetical protein
MLGEALLDAGRSREAVGVLDMARSLAPEDPRVEGLLRRAAGAGGRPEGGPR